MAFESLSDKIQAVFSKLTSKGYLTEADVRSAMKDGSICVLGGEEKIREDEALLKSVRPLVGGEDEK